MRILMALAVCLLATACSKSIPATRTDAASKASSLPAKQDRARTFKVERELTAEELQQIKFPATESGWTPEATSPSAKQDITQKYAVEGNLAAEDLRQIQLLVAGLTYDPILHVKVRRAGLVEVTTGVVLGPLAGHGTYYDFEKRDGQWIRINTDTLKIWRS
jgi:hypothetical protein